MANPVALVVRIILLHFISLFGASISPLRFSDGQRMPLILGKDA
jgi:hypothetical protein